MSKIKNPEKMTVWEKITYSLSGFGEGLPGNIVSAFFMLYLTVYQGLNAVVIGIIICLAKVWDAINDPLIAVLINNTKSRFGQFKPWILFGSFVNGACLAFMFLPVDFSATGKYIYYTVIYVLWGMSFTCVDISYWSMMPSLAKSTSDRSSVTAITRMVSGFGGLVSGSGSSLIITYLVPNGTKNEKAYMIVAAVLSVIFIVFMLLVLIFNKERFKAPKTDLRFKDVFRVFKRNDQLMAFGVSYLFLMLAANMALYQPTYLFIYDYKRLFMGMFIIFSVLGSTVQGWLTIAYPFVAKRVDRKKIFSSLFVIGALGLVLTFVMFAFLKEMPYEQGATQMLEEYRGTTILNIVLISLPVSLLNIASGLGMVSSTVMIADVSDYEQYKNGKRMDSVMFSVQTLVTKFAQAIVSLIMGVALQISGLPTMVQTFNEAGESISTFNGTVTDHMLWILRAFMFLVPIPLIIIGYFIFKKKYNLTSAKMEEIQSQINYHSVESAEEE